MSDEIDYTTEVWKTIAEFPKYAISSAGRVRSFHKRHGNRATHDKTGLRKTFQDSAGYMRVMLFSEKQRFTPSIHRLVATAFLSPDPDRPEVNHKNGIKSDNRPENLEWVTRTENMKHAYTALDNKGQAGSLNGNSRLSEQDVAEIKLWLPRFGDAHLAECFNTSRATIWRIRNGLNWTHVA